MATEKKAAVDEKPVPDKVGVQVVQEKDSKDKGVKADVPAQEEKDLEPEDVKATHSVVKIKNISIKLPEDIHRKLKAKCAMDGESTGNVLKRLIDEYIKG